ncbi:hypothetical protein S245_002415 [Arachis hypogaea]
MDMSKSSQENTIQDFFFRRPTREQILLLRVNLSIRKSETHKVVRPRLSKGKIQELTKHMAVGANEVLAKLWKLTVKCCHICIWSLAFTILKGCICKKDTERSRFEDGS